MLDLAVQHIKGLQNQDQVCKLQLYSEKQREHSINYISKKWRKYQHKLVELAWADLWLSAKPSSIPAANNLVKKLPRWECWWVI